MSDQLFYRSVELDNRALDSDNRSLELSFSSSTGVRRWFGTEILLHGKDNVDLRILKRTGAVLLNHDPSRIVGPISKVWIDDRMEQGRARIGFDRDDIGDLVLGKVQSGSLRGTSVAYSVQKFREVERGEEYEVSGKKITGPAMVALRWTPHEITLTPVPADPSVGVGRELTRSLDGIEIERGYNEADVNLEYGEENDMERDEIIKIMKDVLSDMVNTEVKAAVEGLREDMRPKFGVTAEEYRDLLGQAGAIGESAKAKVADLIAEGRDAPTIQRELVTMATAQHPPPDSTDTAKGSGDQRGQTGATVDTIDDDAFARAINEPVFMPALHH